MEDPNYEKILNNHKSTRFFSRPQKALIKKLMQEAVKSSFRNEKGAVMLDLLAEKISRQHGLGDLRKRSRLPEYVNARVDFTKAALSIGATGTEIARFLDVHCSNINYYKNQLWGNDA